MSGQELNVIDFTPREIALPGRLDALAVQFLTHLRLRGYAKNTQTSYQIDLEQFVGFAAGRDVLYIQTVSEYLIRDFMDAMLGGEMCSARTVVRKLAVIKRLFQFAINRGLMREGENPCKRLDPLKFETSHVIAPPAETILKLIDSIPHNTPLGLRDRALFQLMFDAALRVGGIVSLDLYDEKQTPKYSVHPTGRITYHNKGGGVAESVCGDKTLSMLAGWMAARKHFVHDRAEAALFLSERGTRMVRASVHARIKIYGERIGVPNIHCHMLRHRRVGDIMDNADVHLANYIAGHKNLSTTVNIYGRQNLEAMRERIRRHCPADARGRT